MLALNRPLPKVELRASWFYPLANYSSLIFNSVNINSTLIIGPVPGILALIFPSHKFPHFKGCVAAAQCWLLHYISARGTVSIICSKENSRTFKRFPGVADGIPKVTAGPAPDLDKYLLSTTSTKGQIIQA